MHTVSGKSRSRFRRRSGRHRAGDRLKAALDPAVRAACDPIMVVRSGRCSRATPRPAGIDADLRKHQRAGLPAAGNRFAAASASSARSAGRASIAFCAAAVKAAMAGEVDAVVAAPQNETSIAQAGIKFDGHPSFVARQTGTDESGVYMMLCFGDTRIAHCTLHRSVREAIALITRENVARTIRATDAALQAARHRRRRRSRSAGSIRTPAKADCSAARRSRSSSRRWMQAAAGRDCGRRPVRRRHHVPHAGLRRLRRHAARPGPHRREAHGAERRRGADHRHADPVRLGRARHRPRHRRQGHRQSGGDDRGGAAAGQGEAAGEGARPCL